MCFTIVPLLGPAWAFLATQVPSWENPAAGEGKRGSIGGGDVAFSEASEQAVSGVFRDPAPG